MISLYLLEPLGGALIGLAVVQMIGWQIRKITERLNFYLDRELQAYPLENEVEPIVDEKLDRMIQSFKEQIPMGGMFLSGKLVTGLRSQAKHELISAVPLFKAKLKERAEETIAKLSLAFPLVRLSCIGAAIGFCLGLLEAFLWGYFRGA